MPYAQRLLENGLPRLLENQVVRALELVPAPFENVAQVYPKTWYTWTDRTGITVPDISGPYSLANLTPCPAADAGTLVITADGTVGSMTIGIAVVLWDERGNPMSVNSGMLTLSGWAKNASGNLHHRERVRDHSAGVPRGRCLPRGRVHRTRAIAYSPRHREPAHQALLIVGRGALKTSSRSTLHDSMARHECGQTTPYHARASVVSSPC